MLKSKRDDEAWSIQGEDTHYYFSDPVEYILDLLLDILNLT